MQNIRGAGGGKSSSFSDMDSVDCVSPCVHDLSGVKVVEESGSLKSLNIESCLSFRLGTCLKSEVHT